MSDTYFETLGATVDAVARHAAESRALLARPSEVWSLCQDPLYYGQTRQGHFEIELLRDKKTKKYFHVTVYRMEDGRYEVVSYVL